MVNTVRPNANATPRKPMPKPGKPAARTAAPQPPKVNQNVPKNSAAMRRDMLLSMIPAPVDTHQAAGCNVSPVALPLCITVERTSKPARQPPPTPLRDNPVYRARRRLRWPPDDNYDGRLGLAEAEAINVPPRSRGNIECPASGSLTARSGGIWTHAKTDTPRRPLIRIFGVGPLMAAIRA